MEKLRTYLNGLSKDQRAEFSVRCGTTEGYLRKAISSGQKLGGDLCISIERESGRRVLCEDLRADVDWAFIRQTEATRAADVEPQQDDRRSGEDRRTEGDRRTHEDRRQSDPQGEIYPPDW